MKPIQLTLILAFLLPATTLAQQTQVVLTPDQDAALFEEGDLSAGGNAFLFAGATAVGDLRRSLIRFDFSGIPNGATIDNVQLTLNMSRTISGPLTVRVHRLLADWGEGNNTSGMGGGGGAPANAGDATWNHRSFNTVLWTSPGGDFDPTASASATVDDVGFYNWTSPAMITDVQNWVDGGAGNFGWAVVANEAAGIATAKRFDSRENGTAGNRPMLTVTYTFTGPPPSTGIGIPTLSTWGLAVMILALMVLGMRKVGRLD